MSSPVPSVSPYCAKQEERITNYWFLLEFVEIKLDSDLHSFIIQLKYLGLSHCARLFRKVATMTVNDKVMEGSVLVYT